MPKYQGVFFDLGYTLVYTDRSETLREDLARLGIFRDYETLEKGHYIVDQYFMQRDPELLRQHPRNFYAVYLRRLLRTLDLPDDLLPHLAHRVETLRDIERWRLFSDVLPALGILRDLNITLGVVTNWDRTARDVINALELTQYLKVIVVSSEVGMNKPDGRIFEVALAEAGLKPQDALFVGDNYYDDVVGARSVGMDQALIDRYGLAGDVDCRVYPHVGAAIGDTVFRL